MDLNKVTLIGRLGKDPEPHAFGDEGNELVRLSLATSSKSNGKEYTEWHRIVVFDKHIVNILKKYCQKGSKLYLEGELRTRKYDKEGATHYSTEVVLSQYGSKVILLDSKSEGARDQINSEGPRSTDSQSNGAQPGYVDDGFDDDIPF